MRFKNNIESWGLVSWFLHWLLAALVIWMIFQGNQMEAMERGPEKIEQINLHKSVGVLVLALIVLRLFWRLYNRVPFSPEQTPPLKILASRVNHWLLYLLTLLQPVSGMAMSVSAGYPPNFFGLWQFPQAMPKNEAAAEAWHAVHVTCWWFLAALIIVHILAALHHHFFVRDQVLRRMLRPS